MRHSDIQTQSYCFVNYCNMTEKENEKIWNIRNNTLISVWMINNKWITHSEHDMFINSLRSKMSKDYFLIKNFDGNIIGSVNFTYLNDGIVERGIFINPKFWGKNHAYLSLSELYSYINKHWSIKRIITQVKVDNAASNALERKLGGQIFKSEDGYNYYIVNL